MKTRCHWLGHRLVRRFFQDRTGRFIIKEVCSLCPFERIVTKAG